MLGDIRVARLSICNVRNANMTVFWAALFSICITNTISNYKMTYPAAGPRPCAFSSTESWAALKPLTEAEEQMRWGSFYEEQPYLHCFGRCLTSKAVETELAKQGRVPIRSRAARLMGLLPLLPAGPNPASSRPCEDQQGGPSVVR